MDSLPHFNDHHCGHDKGSPLTAITVTPEPFLTRFLDQAAAGRARDRVRVLDMGCGRGELVGWLCSQGWDAWGAEIEPSYLANGQSFFETSGYGADRLRLIDGEMPFPPDSFDVVLSDQVLEHVADLDSFARGVAQVSAPGSSGLHIMPGPWRPVETHMGTPLVHWLPKGRARRKLLRPLLAAGLAYRIYPDYSLADRVEIFGHFSDTDTFYRSREQVEAGFRGHGLDCDSLTGTRDKLANRLPALPTAVLPWAARLYGTFQTLYVRTRKPPEPGQRPEDRP